MTDKISDENRDPKGLFLPGNRGGPGRPKGSGNVFSMDLKAAIEEAFIQLGGVQWLVALGRDDPKAFAALLAKLLPKQLEADIEVTQNTGPGRIEMVIIDPAQRGPD
ncbi:hypothetical protein HFU84_12945 [Acidithiobacillus sp. CV18-2]|nr:hypothetical protein [Acidithiobacillus sp. CV18-3]MBU2758430.1 hypothetical protein [Acidithiobacillus sp. BN09-2]MBU2778386.1 hypothetical protein [Acidithiobacillus sp. CV18-2]MBU2798270.1 hypothetical protein [Acidithiobacillus sp. VAN18-4]